MEKERHTHRKKERDSQENLERPGERNNVSAKGISVHQRIRIVKIRLWVCFSCIAKCQLNYRTMSFQILMGRKITDFIFTVTILMTKKSMKFDHCPLFRFRRTDILTGNAPLASALEYAKN